MKLNAGLHLACISNVHRGETWEETFESLKKHTLPLRERVCPSQPFGLTLALTHRAARELSEGAALFEFLRWLAHNQCYIVALDGGPVRSFRQAPVRELVYEPDWASPERLAYTNLLFDLLARLLPEGITGNVATLPGSYKVFHVHADQLRAIRNMLWHCLEHIARVSEQTGRNLCLSLEPEPLCLLESSGETIQFFDRMRAEHPRDPRLAEHLSVNYDTCHFAVEFEEPQDALLCLQQHGIKVANIHLSSALKAHGRAEARAALAALPDDGYLHQVVIRHPDGERVIYPGLREALATEPEENEAGSSGEAGTSEWRVHFHLPLHSPPVAPFDNTHDHILTTLDLLMENPGLCSCLQIKSEAWDMLPEALRSADLPGRLGFEYDWLLTGLVERGLANPRADALAHTPGSSAGAII